MKQRLIPWMLGLLMMLAFVSTAAGATPYENRFEPVPATYTFQIDTSFHSVTRTRFDRPVFLFQNRLKRVRSEAMVTTLSMDIHWTDAIALQFSVPLEARFALVDFAPVQISQNQTLPSQSKEYLGFGLGDPTLSLSWLVWEKETWNLYGQVGTRVPLDDNSGAAILPTRLPHSTGQNAIFGGLGTNIAISSLRVHIHYRGDYLPGNAASYLIHQAGGQTWLTGNVGPSHKHHVHGTFSASPTETLTVELTPGWIVTWLPKLITRGNLVEDQNVEFLEDLYVEGAIRWKLSKRYTLRAWYRTSLRDSSALNPFFPIELPVQGGGFSLTATRW